MLWGFEALLAEVYLLLFPNYRNSHGGLAYFTFGARCERIATAYVDGAYVKRNLPLRGDESLAHSGKGVYPVSRGDKSS